MTTILRRLLQLIPTLIGVSIITFFMMRLTPGDPVKLMLGPEATEESINVKYVELGFKRYTGGAQITATVESLQGGVLTLRPTSRLDVPAGETVRLHVGRHLSAAADSPGAEIPPAIHPVSAVHAEDLLVVRSFRSSPAIGSEIELLANRELVDRWLPVQYLSWLYGIVTLDWGTSISTERPVVREIVDRAWPTVQLALVSMLFAIVTGVIIGVLSAVYPRTLLDNVTRIVVFVFLAMPSFWLGLELIIIFSRKLGWFLPSGTGSLNQLVLPSITLGVGTGAFLCRILRSSMLQVLNADYVRTARAKGLDGKWVVLKHALKNAMIPFVTVAGLSLGTLLGGSVIVETVFQWPGIGKLLIDSILARDFPVTMGCVLVLAGIFVFVNLFVDLLYVVLDPRIRLDGAN